MHVYLLSGGQSRRFGSDKSRASWNGQTSLQHQARFWRDAGMTVISVAANPDAYIDLGIETIADDIPNLGPLAGLATSLRHQQRLTEQGWAIVSSCDLLDPPEAVLSSLLPLVSSNTSAVIFEDTQYQPFPGLYHTSSLAIAEPMLASPRRSMQGFLELLRSQSRLTTVSQSRRLASANTTEEWMAWLKAKNLDPTEPPCDGQV